MPTTQIDQKLKATRDAFGEAIVEIAKTDPKIVALSANLTESTRLNEFAKLFPQRYFEIGVAEQNLASVAAGLALSGKIPFMTSFAAFSPGCNWQQIRTGICYNKANVKIVSTHAGISVGADGAMHQSLEDIALTRVLPNLTVICPCDCIETKKAIRAAARYNGPVYIRLSREPVPNLTDETTEFNLGQAVKLQEGTQITIIATGLLVYQAKLAADKLEQAGISVELIDCHTIKPLDETTILNSAQKTKRVITVEEHQITGGLGSAVAELLAEKYPVPMKRIGALDTFGESGNPAELLSKYKMDSVAIIDAVKNIIGHPSAA